jgi:hypothetical protein
VTTGTSSLNGVLLSHCLVLDQPQVEVVELKGIDPAVDHDPFDDADQGVDGFVQSGFRGEPEVAAVIGVH